LADQGGRGLAHADGPGHFENDRISGADGARTSLSQEVGREEGEPALGGANGLQAEERFLGNVHFLPGRRFRGQRNRAFDNVVRMMRQPCFRTGCVGWQQQTQPMIFGIVDSLSRCGGWAG